MSTTASNDLTEFPFLTILSKCLDAFVPVYSLIVFYIIWNHHRNSQKKANQNHNYVLKKTSTDTSSGKKDWRALMCGRFNQGEAEGLDRWLVYIRKSYAARLIAPALFFKLNNNLTLTDTIFDVSSDFGNSGIPSKAPNLRFEIGSSEANAKPIQAVDKDGILCEYRCWINEGEETLYVSFEPVDKSGPYLKTWHIRRMLDPDLIEMKWKGVWSDTGEKNEMITYYRRIA